MHADKRRWNIYFCSDLISDSGSGSRHVNRMNKKTIKRHKVNSLDSTSTLIGAILSGQVASVNEESPLL
jgi:hypothetical protein